MSIKNIIMGAAGSSGGPGTPWARINNSNYGCAISKVVDDKVASVMGLGGPGLSIIIYNTTDGSISSQFILTGGQYDTTSGYNEPVCDMDSSGNVYIARGYYDNSASKSNTWVVKISSSGTVVWSKNIYNNASSASTGPRGISWDSVTNTVLVYGGTKSATASGQCFYIAKFNASDGSVLGTALYRDSSAGNTYTSSNGSVYNSKLYIPINVTTVPGGYNFSAVISIDCSSLSASNNIKISKSVADGHTTIYGFSVGPTGDVFAGAMIGDSAAQKYNSGYLFKMNNSLSMQSWQYVTSTGAGTYIYEYCNTAAQAPNGDVYLTGSIYDDTATTSYKDWIAKLNSSLSPTWIKYDDKSNINVAASSSAYDQYNNVYFAGQYLFGLSSVLKLTPTTTLSNSPYTISPPVNTQTSVSFTTLSSLTFTLNGGNSTYSSWSYTTDSASLSSTNITGVTSSVGSVSPTLVNLS